VLASPSANESFVLSNPDARDNALLVLNSGNPPGTTETGFTAQTAFAQPGTGIGDFAVTPTSTSAQAGRPERFTATWSGLGDTTPYVGWIGFADGSGVAVTLN
jgi:hypothetical protein